MTATLHPYGTLKQYTAGQSEIAVQAGQTVREACAALGLPAELIALVTVNDQQQDKDYVIRDGDVVRLLAVIGGG